MAQPQFTHNHYFQVGDTSRLRFAIVTQTFDDFKLLTRNNNIWNFSKGQTPNPWTS